MMNDQEKLMAKAINDLASFMGRNVKTSTEKDTVQDALDKLTTELILIVGRRTIKDTK